MLKEYISEKTAKTLIFLFFAGTLIATVLLFLNARFSAGQAETNGAEEMERQQEQLAEMMALNQQMALLEQQLKQAQEELLSYQEENQELNQQQEQLLERQAEIETTREELLSSFGMRYVGDFYATAYCAEAYPHICGGNGVTASGTVPTPGLTCAADWNVFPPGTWLYIDGIGMRRVEDSGSAINGNRLDIVVDTHANALRWGGQGNHSVWVME